MSAARSRIIGAIVVVGLSRVLAGQMASPIVRPSLPVAAQTSPIELAVPSLTVRFEGGDVPANASKVLRVLELQNLLETRTATIGKGQSLCDLYRELIGFPMGCTAELVQLANEMNGRNYSKQILRIGEKIEYPDVYFLKTPWTKRFDPKVDQKALEDFRRNWSRYILSEDKLATGMVKLNLEAYELRVPVLTAVDARRAATELAGAKIPNITVSHPDEQKRLLKYHSTIPPAKYVSDCQARLLQADQQCAYAFLVGLEKLDWAPCSGPCPDVFLVDRPVRRHPSLTTAVLDGFVDDLEPAPADPLCALPPLKDGDHGTHLAAIIGAAGPACVGLFPGVRLHSWNREGPDEITRADIERVQENFENNIATVGLPIFVFASSWEFTGKNGQAGARLEDTSS